MSTKKVSVMIQGTASDVGKSTVVAALCRYWANRQYSVAPFKPQNMALNSAVSDDGGEMGRAQALQALACKIPSSVDMNPILLKPSSDKDCQVIVCGEVIQTMGAWGYHNFKAEALPHVLRAYQRLHERFPLIVTEGAGSPAEINLRDNDIANMGFAEAVDCPVILVADIDKGGVFAQLVGTLELLSASERNRVIGFIINKFRGDLSLLQPGLDWLEKKTGKKVWGVLPYLHDLFVDAEDAIDTKQVLDENAELIKVVVPVLTRTSNHTDFDALRMHPLVDLQFIGQGQRLPACDLIILPGSKNVRADLAYLRDNKWDADIQRHCRYGGKVLGICGGYQMLGRAIHDPLGIEGEIGSSEGLSYLNIETELQATKQLHQVHVKWSSVFAADHGKPFSAYEIHCGITRGDGLARPLVVVQQSPAKYDGALSNDGQVAGCYMHGLLDDAQACQRVLSWAGLHNNTTHSDKAAITEQQLERLAGMCESHLDMPALDAFLFGSAAERDPASGNQS